MNAPPPAWLMEAIREAKKGVGQAFIQQTRRQLAALNLPTVCESARCPNYGECFSNGTATFLILGTICTRRCAFCAVLHGIAPSPPDSGEPERLARAVTKLQLSHVVITSVTRDDLSDGGAAHYVQVINTLRSVCPGVTIELLVPDFNGNESAFMAVLKTNPDVLAHNVETVPRLYEAVRSGADFEYSLQLLLNSKRLDPSVITKSGLMLGLGESPDEVDAVLADLAAVECDLLTIGQYLAPSLAHVPVARYVTQDEFDQWRTKALALGFKQVVSGPLVRSSFNASRLFGGMS